MRERTSSSSRHRFWQDALLQPARPKRHPRELRHAALYLFPTKALAQDQLAELYDLNQRLENCFGVFTYDGDTPADARKAIREKGTSF